MSAGPRPALQPDRSAPVRSSTRPLAHETLELNLRRPRGSQMGRDTALTAILTRATIASVLAVAGGFAGFGVAGIFQMLGDALGGFWGAFLADRSVGIALGAYTAASAPYAWMVAREWLVATTDVSYSAYRQLLQSNGVARPAMGSAARYVPRPSTVLATVALGPFLGPIGIAMDVAYLRDVHRRRRRPVRTEPAPPPNYDALRSSEQHLIVNQAQDVGVDAERTRPYTGG